MTSQSHPVSCLRLPLREGWISPCEINSWYFFPRLLRCDFRTPPLELSAPSVGDVTVPRDCGGLSSDCAGLELLDESLPFCWGGDVTGVLQRRLLLAVVGLWSLVVGLWSLVVGLWSLVVVFWLLFPAARSSTFRKVRETHDLNKLC